VDSTLSPPRKDKFTILLDVDGVLNDWSAHPTRELDTGLDYTEFEASPYVAKPYETVAGFRIFYSKEILSRLHALAARDDVEIKWLTTWCHGANTGLRAEFGFAEDLEVVGNEFHRNEVNYEGWWKFAAVQKYYLEHPDEYIIWVDDDLAWEDDALEWAGDRPDVLVVAPNPCLRHEDLDTIEKWIN
jgi:hypothetical protein